MNVTFITWQSVTRDSLINLKSEDLYTSFNVRPYLFF